MIYFLDFDRTLFNFDSFIEKVIEKYPEIKSDIESIAMFPSGAPERQVVWDKVFELIQRRALSLSDEEFAACLFEDVLPFAEKHSKDIVIATSGNPEFQEYKLQKTLSQYAFQDILICDVNSRKGDMIHTWLGDNKPPAVFVDDSQKHLKSVSEKCPWISVLEMRRDTQSGSGEFPVVHALKNVDQYVEKEKHI